MNEKLNSVKIKQLKNIFFVKLIKLLFNITLLLFTLHLSDAFIQSNLQSIQVIHLLSVHVFPGNRTHNLCAANAMLYHWATGTHGLVATCSQNISFMI